MWWRASREGKREVEGFECTLALVWSDKVPWTMEWEGSSSGEEREEGREGDVGDNGEKRREKECLICGPAQRKNHQTRLGWA